LFIKGFPIDYIQKDIEDLFKDTKGITLIPPVNIFRNKVDNSSLSMGTINVKSDDINDALDLNNTVMEHDDNTPSFTINVKIYDKKVGRGRRRGGQKEAGRGINEGRRRKKKKKKQSN
jgi:hypothetical protein